MTAIGTTRRVHRLGLAVAIVGTVLAGCGGGGSSTGPSRSGAALKRLEVEVVQGSAAVPSRSVLARVADMLGWPQVAEASHCTVTAGGVSAATGPDERAVLSNVPLDANGNVLVTITCPGGVGGSFTLAGGPPGTVVALRVDVRPGRVEVRVRDQHVSQVSQPSPPSPPSQPSRRRSGSSAGGS